MERQVFDCHGRIKLSSDLLSFFQKINLLGNFIRILQSLNRMDMSEEEVIKELGKTWAEEKHNYVLVKSTGPFFRYTIMSIVYNTMLIIEEDDIAQYVIKRMLENGVRVVDDFEQVRNPNRPDPIFYSAEHEAKYKKWQEWKKNEELNKKKE
jgi:hypothetical protein